MRFDSGRLFRLYAGVAAPVAILAACIVAEPGADVPKPAPQRPHILRSSTVPPSGAILGALPSKFVVPVELADPTLSFDYTSFIDYDPSAANGGVGWSGSCVTSTFESANIGGAPRLVEVFMDLQHPPSPDRCHVIEVVVALHLRCDLDSNAAHSPPEPGGDNVTWIYSPSGDLAGCPVLDAGLEASRNDDAGNGLPP